MRKTTLLIFTLFLAGGLCRAEEIKAKSSSVNTTVTSASLEERKESFNNDTPPNKYGWDPDDENNPNIVVTDMYDVRRDELRRRRYGEGGM
jgi:hypothetical protein